MKKKYRIKKNEEFQSIIHEKNTVINKHFILYASCKKEQFARVGISVSKKLGGAVDRNLYKRQIRMMVHEIFDFENFPADIVIIARHSIKQTSYLENKKVLENTLKKVKIK